MDLFQVSHIAILILLGIRRTAAGGPQTEVSREGLELVDLINDYRVNNGATEIPYSLAMLTVAAEQVQNHLCALRNGLWYDDSSECSAISSWYDEVADASLYSGCCYDPTDSSTHTCSTLKPYQITSDWTSPYQKFQSYSYLLASEGEASMQDALNDWISNPTYKEFILNEGSNFVWRSIGCAVDSTTDYSNDPAIVPRYYCWFSHTGDRNTYTNPYRSSVSPTLAPVTTTPVPRTYEEFTNYVNDYRVAEGGSRLIVSDILMTVGREHMANYQWASDAGVYAYGGSCGAPFSWYDEGTSKPWRSCCYSGSGDTCTTSKAIEISCGTDAGFYHLINGVSNGYYLGRNYETATALYVSFKRNTIMVSSWRSIGCAFHQELALYTCYFSQYESPAYIGGDE